MRYLVVFLTALLMIGCQAVDQVAGIHKGIFDPTGVESLVQVGDSRLRACSELGMPDRTFVGKSGQLSALVFFREGAEAVVIVDNQSEQVLAVYNAQENWMDQAQINRIERTLRMA